MSGSALQFWEDSHAQGLPADSFLAHPLIQLYVSMRAFGDLRGQIAAAIAVIERRTRPGARILSVGCGAATKERALGAALRDRAFVGIDIAEATLARARADVERRGVTNVELVRGDFDALELEPASFEMILGLGAIHHVAHLEQFWLQCRRALRPGGCVLAQEYVGPSRFQWTDAELELGAHALAALVPPAHHAGRIGVQRVPLDQLIRADPSEAVRSAEILATCRQAGFAIEDYSGAGCGLLQPLLMDRVATFDPRDWAHNQVLFALFAEEDRHMRAGALGDHYATFVAA